MSNLGYKALDGNFDSDQRLLQHRSNMCHIATAIIDCIAAQPIARELVARTAVGYDSSQRGAAKKDFVPNSGFPLASIIRHRHHHDQRLSAPK